MATIAKMVIAGIVDPTGVKKGLAESLAELQKFKRLASKRIDMELAFPDLKKAEAAQKLLGGLTKTFEAAMSDAKFDLGAEKIDTKKFKALGLQARKDFNAGLAASINRLDKAGLLTPQIYKSLVDQFKTVGEASGKAMGKGAQRGVAAHPLLGNLTTTGQRAANTLLNGLNTTFNQRVSDLREQFANKLITAQQFRRKGQQAADEFDKGITAGLAGLRGKNQATKAITEALVDSYKLAGTKAANQFQFSLDKQLGENVSRVGGALTKTLTVPIVAAAAAAIKLGADFELSMNRIRGILQPTEDDMTRLAAQARKIGAETQFSSRDAAEAQAFLAQQTHSVAITLAAMPAVTNLAAAGLIDMATAAEISTKILKGFGIPIEDLALSVDQLVLLTSLGATNITELGEAFKFVGPNARRLNQDFKTIGAALGALSAAGQPGSLGGTALRGVLQSLIRPSKQAAAALKTLRVEVKDENHEFRDLIDIVKQFERAQQNSTGRTFEFQQAIATIFQQRAGTGFSNLLAIGSEELERFRDQLDKAGGTSKRVGDVQMSGAIGAFRELQSALEELALAFTDSGLLKFITNLARTLANMVRALKDINPSVLKFATYLALIAATLGPMLFSLGKTITLMATMRAILVTLNGPTALAGLASSLVVGGAILGGLILLASIFVKVAADAANATAKIEEFRSSLSKKTVADLESLRADIVTSVNFNKKLVEKLQAEQLKQDAFMQGKGFASGPGSDLTKVTDLLKEQQRMLADVDKALVDARKSATELAKAGKVTTTVADDPIDFDAAAEGAEKAKSLIDQLSERIKLLTGTTEALNNKIADQPKLIDGLSKAWALVNFWILQAGGAINETTLELLKMRKELAEVFKDVDVILPKMSEEEFARAIGADKPLRLRFEVTPMMKNFTFITAKGPLDKAVEEFEKAANKALSTKLDLDLLGRTKNLGAVKVAAGTYADALGKAKIAESSLSKAILDSNLPLAEKEELIKKINAAMDALEKTSKKSTKNLQRIATSLQGLADAVRGILSIAEAFGEVDARAASALNAVADLASALSNFAQSVATGDVFGAIASAIGSVGSLIKLGQSLFGKSENDKKREDIFRSNTAAMAELKRSIDAWSLTVSVIGRSQPVIDATIASIREALAKLFQRAGKTFDFSKVQFKSVEEFDKQLRAAGSSFEEIQQIAKELNIDLFNEKGRLSAAGLQALTEAMDLQRIKLTQFGKSLDDVRNRMELKRNVFNLDTSPVADLQQNIDLLKQFVPGIASMFSGFNAATEAGRAQIEKALQTLFTMLEQKMIDPTLFGDLSLQDLTGIIGDMADALDTFREKTDDAAKDIVNIPAGFKIARFAFKAQLEKAADSTKKFADRVDTVTPTDASPIQQLMLALGGLVPKINEAKVPDLKPLDNLMTALGTVAASELPAFAKALEAVTASAPTWGELPSVEPLRVSVTDIAGAGDAVAEALAAIAERIRGLDIGTPAFDTRALPDLQEFTSVVDGVTTANMGTITELDSFSLALIAARDALTGGSAVPIVPPDLTPLTDVLTSVSGAGTTTTETLNAFALALVAARDTLAGAVPIAPPDVTPLTEAFTNVRLVSVATAADLGELSLAIRAARGALTGAEPVAPPDVSPLTDTFAAVSLASITTSSDLGDLSLALRAAREALTGGAAVPIVPPDMTPLTDVLTSVTASGATATSELTSFTAALATARVTLAGDLVVPFVPPDMTAFLALLVAITAAGLTATLELDAFAAALRNATVATTAVSTGAVAVTSPSATVTVRDVTPVAPEPLPSNSNMTLIIQANVQQTQNPEDWYAGIKKVAKDKVRAKYGAAAVTRVEENLP